jgi:hypothetical protein
MWCLYYVCGGNNNTLDLLLTICDINEAIYMKKELEIELINPDRDYILISNLDFQVGR